MSSSRYGRRIVILFNLAIQAIFGVAAAFAPNFYVYVALRFVVGTTISGIVMNAFVLGQCHVESFCLCVGNSRKLKSNVFLQRECHRYSR